MFNKLIVWARQNIDKVCHYLVCLLISLLTILTMSMLMGVSTWISGIVGFIITVIIGILKEVYDSKHGGIFDKRDLTADIIGGISGTVIGVIFILLT